MTHSPQLGDVQSPCFFHNTSYPCFRFIMHNGGGMNRLQRQFQFDCVSQATFGIMCFLTYVEAQDVISSNYVDTLMTSTTILCLCSKVVRVTTDYSKTFTIRKLLKIVHMAMFVVKSKYIQINGSSYGSINTSHILKKLEFNRKLLGFRCSLL